MAYRLYNGIIAIVPLLVMVVDGFSSDSIGIFFLICIPGWILTTCSIYLFTKLNLSPHLGGGVALALYGTFFLIILILAIFFWQE